MRALVRLRRSNRGIAAMLGIAFFLLLFIASITTVFVMTNALMDLQGTARITAEAETERTQERIEITSAYLKDNGPSRPLVLNMTNSGSVTAVLSRLIIINVTDNDHQVFSFNATVNPGDSVTNTTQVSFPTGKEYEIRVVSERGNTASFNLVPALNVRLALVVPASVFLDTDFSVVLLITNNDTSANSIVNLEPDLNLTSTTSSLVSGPTPAKVPLLTPGSTASFTFVLNAPSTVSTDTINGTFKSAPQGTWITTTISVVQPPETENAKFAKFAQFSSGVLGVDLLAAIPNPSDSSGSDMGKYAVVIQNTLNRTVTVYAVAIVSPSEAVFGQGGTLTPVKPTSGWSQDQPTSTSGILLWEGSSSGITVPAISAEEWIVKVEGKISVVKETPLIVQALTSEGKIFTTFAATVEGSLSTINVYQTGTPASPETDYGYIVLNAKTAVVKNYNVTVENSSDSNNLSSDIALNILVPYDFTDISADSGQTGWGTPTITENPDGSNSIKVTSSSSTLSAGSSLVFVFSAKSPTLTVQTLYTVPISAVFPDISPRTTSPIAQFAVQVIL